MINTREDMLDAEHQISPGNFEATGRCFDDKRRGRRSKVSHLLGPIDAFYAHEDIRESCVEAIDSNRRATKAARAGNAPLFGVSTACEIGARCGEVGTRLRKPHVEAEAHGVGDSGNFPKDIVSVAAGLVDLQISGPHLVSSEIGCEGSE